MKITELLLLALLVRKVVDSVVDTTVAPTIKNDTFPDDGCSRIIIATDKIRIIVVAIDLLLDGVFVCFIATIIIIIIIIIIILVGKIEIQMIKDKRNKKTRICV